MKKAIRVIIPLILILAIIICIGWYLFIYDREFTRDMLLYAARRFDDSGNRVLSSLFYDFAYKQADDNSAVAIELAEQHKKNGNYTKAEYTLSRAIADGGSLELYIALCKTYVEQDKLLDAVQMLNKVSNPDIKAQLDAIRPSAPTCSPDPSTTGAYHTQYITITLSAEAGTLYANRNGEFPSVETDLYEHGITLTDGENVIYSVAISENGLVSPVSIFGFTIGGIIKQMDFVDAAIEKEVRKLLNVNEDKVLFTNDLWTIREFSVPADATTLEDLQHMLFLQKLSMQDGVSGQLSFISGLSDLNELSITDTVVNVDELKLIAKFPRLEKLTLSGCRLSTVSGLETAVNLIYLDLSNNSLRNLSPLKGLTKLKEIHLQHNALNNLAPLSTMQALTALDVSYNALSTLSPLCTIPGLTWIEAGHNYLIDLEEFHKLTALEHLGVSNNSIADLTPLSSCTKLAYLNISDNTIVDLSALSELNNLENLYFSNNQVKELPAWGPECQLINIDGSNNLLASLEPLKGLQQLNNVFMDYNKDIKSVECLASCPILIQVNVFGTKVTDVSSLTSQSVVVNFDPTK